MKLRFYKIFILAETAQAAERAVRQSSIAAAADMIRLISSHGNFGFLSYV